VPFALPRSIFLWKILARSSAVVPPWLVMRQRHRTVCQREDNVFASLQSTQIAEIWMLEL
jgi:hypothetical protein